MLPSNYQIFLIVFSLFFLSLSCESSSSKEELKPGGDLGTISDTVVIRDTVFVSDVEVLEEEEVQFFPIVKAAKMNVLYKGVDNPLLIVVPGLTDEEIDVNISNGSINKMKERGNYRVNVKAGNKAIISLFHKEDGLPKLIGKYEFRVKTVPDPTPYFAGKGVGDDRVKKIELAAAQGVAARMQNFDFDLKFTVTSFTLTMFVGGTPIEKKSNSNRVTGDMKVMLKKAKAGTKIYIENIRARGPDGTVRKLGSLAFKVI